MNENGVLGLLPWSAAGPITRASEGMTNWLFRLSVDDSQSGEFFIREAVDKAACTRMALILLDTGWGRANHKTLTQALERRGMEPVATEFFSVAVGAASVHNMAERISIAQADCAVLLSNWDDGALVLNELHSVKSNIRVFSHWGIMGGEFSNLVPPATRDAMSLQVFADMWPATGN